MTHTGSVRQYLDFGMFCFSTLSAILFLVFTEPIVTKKLIHTTHNAQSKWIRKYPAPASQLLPIRIGLKQRNLHRLSDFVSAVSDPHSEDYGKHWTNGQIHQTVRGKSFWLITFHVCEQFSPSRNTVRAVTKWLQSSNIEKKRILLSPSRHWLLLNATISEIEKLLDAKYHLYEHSDDGRVHFATEQYSIPKHLSDSIDLITPTIGAEGIFKACLFSC